MKPRAKPTKVRKSRKAAVVLLSGGNPQIAKADTSLRPVPPGVSKHKDVRYFDIREDDQLDEAQMASWVNQAAALPGFLAPRP